jgi:hypothetical protein
VSASTSLLRYSELSVYVESRPDRIEGCGLSFRPVSGAYCPPDFCDRPKYESGRKLPRPRVDSSRSGDRSGDRPREPAESCDGSRGRVTGDISMGSDSDAKGLCRAGGVVGDAEREEYAERGPREDIVRVCHGP